MSLATVGTRVEFARYAAAGEERALYGQRVDGIVRVTDCPIAGKGRRYLVERGLTCKGELDALVADYVAQAHRQGAPPAEIRWL